MFVVLCPEHMHYSIIVFLSNGNEQKTRQMRLHLRSDGSPPKNAFMLIESVFKLAKTQVRPGFRAASFYASILRCIKESP